MDKVHLDVEMEKLNHELNDPHALEAYREPYDHYRPKFIPRMLGGFLVWWGNFVYGKEPSYLKFRAIEVVARVPYHSWASAMYTLLTLNYSDEAQAMKLSRVALFSRHSQDNETMHVVVVSQFTKRECKAGVIMYAIVPVIFSFFYFWASYVLFLVHPRYSYELNYIFESHAFEQYSRFLELHGEELKKKSAHSEFLAWYGRQPRSQYEFFMSVRNDELIHRNASLKEIGAL